MSRRGSGRRSVAVRTLNATMTGIVAGVGTVVVIRAVFGPDLAFSGTLVGVVALVVGAGLSFGLSASRRRERHRLPGGQRVRPRVHAVAWFAPVAGSVFAVLAWAAVAHSSGSGWVQAVGALMAAVLVTGLAAPLFPARRGTAVCTWSPSDGVAGEPVGLTLEVNGAYRITPRYPVGPACQAAGRSRGRRSVEMTVTPDRRGVTELVVIELASCAPFGLLWWAHDLEVDLPRPLHVAPRSGPPGAVETRSDDALGDAVRRVPAGLGDPRGVRPYRPGDTRRSIHWPATSHVGSLMVREKERQTDDPIVVEVVLSAVPAEAESETERFMAAVSRYLAAGQPVVLVTDEVEGRTVRPVVDRIDLGRRLARAVAAPGAHADPMIAVPSTTSRRHRRAG
jgi:uncharacterized protein (DUF58 family)